MAESKINILIVEDDPIIADDLSAYIEEFGYQPYPTLPSAEEALLFLSEHTPDLIILDVRLEGKMDGTQLAKIIRSNYTFPIIFLTAHYDRDTMDQIKATRPEAYLVKPIEGHNLQTSIEVALHNFFSTKQERESGEVQDFNSQSHFFIKVRDKLTKVNMDEVLWIEAYDNYAYIQTSASRFLTNSNLKSIEEKLSSSPFLRIHRSYLINLHKIDIVKQHIVQVAKTELPIGKTYRSNLLQKISLL